MNFQEALKLLKQGKSVISKKDKESYDQQFLSMKERNKNDNLQRFRPTKSN